MKLVVIFKDAITGNKRLLPRDIRNYLGAITQDNEELHRLVMWHEHKQPPFIYSMPNRKSFGIFSFLKEDEIANHFKSLKKAIESNPILKLAGLDLEVKEVFTTSYEYTRFQEGFFERKFITPMILGSSKREYARARQLSEGNNIDKAELNSFITDTINESIRFQNRDWFEVEDFEVEDLMLMYKDVKYTVVKYNETQWYPAVMATVISNKMLPQFLGYKCGMGYGELASLKNMQRRGK